jgi:hypothetical protein
MADFRIQKDSHASAVLCAARETVAIAPLSAHRTRDGPRAAQQSDAPANRLNTCGLRADGASTAVVRPDLSDGFMAMYSTSPRTGHDDASRNAAWIATRARCIMDF